MADGDLGKPPGRVIGMEDYRAARLRSLETLVMALVKREANPAWLQAMIAETEALPINGPDWVSLWRARQLQLLNKALYGEQQILAQGDLWDDDIAVQLEADSIVEELGRPGEPPDYTRFADATERELARHLTAQHLDPPEPEYWRDVIAELRRRADAAAAA